MVPDASSPGGAILDTPTGRSLGNDRRSQRSLHAPHLAILRSQALRRYVRENEIDADAVAETALDDFRALISNVTHTSRYWSAWGARKNLTAYDAV